MVATLSKNQINLTITAGSSSEDHTPKAPETQLYLSRAKKQTSRGDPGATDASTKNASRQELDVKGILDLKGKWKKTRRRRKRERQRAERERKERKKKQRREKTKSSRGSFSRSHQTLIWCLPIGGSAERAGNV